MALDHDLVGVPGPASEISWDSTSSILYALGVGAGSQDPLDELEFTTEAAIGDTQRVLPTFAAVLAGTGRPQVGSYDYARLVHAEQAITWHRPLPVAGTARRVPTVTAIFDKGSGALIVVETEVTEAATDEPLVSSRSTLFIRGEGGFGGSRGPKASWQHLDRAPDHSIAIVTRPEQALLYRLCGDRNPLHVDPVTAARGGFDRPILHGLCTYGVAGRVLVRSICGGDPDRLGAMSARFTSPAWPADTLTVSVWLAGNQAQFQVTRDDGTVVLDQGVAHLRD
jgi:acyl dehydratase